MPSTLLGQPDASGPQLLVSGFPWSGRSNIPAGGVQLRLDPSSSGNAYIGFSGSLTRTSGGMFLSGGGLADGMLMAPGDSYFVPKMALPTSGSLNIYARHDAACSGQGRLYWEIL